MKRPMVEYIIEALEPTFAESISNAAWACRYAMSLDNTLALHKEFQEDGVEFTTRLNDILRHSAGPQHDAYVDVASCLESLCPEEYSGKFVY